jgi:hypothetical protein
MLILRGFAFSAFGSVSIMTLRGQSPNYGASNCRSRSNKANAPSEAAREIEAFESAQLIVRLLEQLRQLGDVDGDLARFVACEQTGCRVSVGNSK